MKYLISFFILAIATFISLSETRKLPREIVEDERQDRKKWEPYYRCHKTSEIVKMAIRQYNHNYHSHYRKKRIILAEKTVEQPSKIRVFFNACTKTCKRHSKYRKNSRRSRKHKKTCDIFRATFEEYKSSKPKISVRNLDKQKGTGARNPSTTKPPSRVTTVTNSAKRFAETIPYDWRRK